MQIYRFFYNHLPILYKPPNLLYQKNKLSVLYKKTKVSSKKQKMRGFKQVLCTVFKQMVYEY